MALLANYKVGDHVEYEVRGPAISTMVGGWYPGLRGRGTGVLVKPTKMYMGIPTEWICRKDGDGETFKLDEAMISRRVSNSAVANATTANATYGDVMKESKKMASAAWKLTMDTPPAEAKAKWPNMYRYLVKTPEYVKRWSAEIKAVGNAVARNASSFEFGVGDKVGVGGKTGFVKAKYFKDGKICIDVDIGSKVVTVEPKDIVKNAVVSNALAWKRVVAKNAAYSNTLKYIMDAVKPYLDKRFKGDDAWKYPSLVITVLRKVCDTATMSAGRYDGRRPPHRIYDIKCTRDGYMFEGNLVCTGLLYRNDPDDVSAFDEYDMTMSLMNVGKATNALNSNVAMNAGQSNVDIAWNYIGEASKKFTVISRCLYDIKSILAIADAYIKDAVDDREPGEVRMVMSAKKTYTDMRGFVERNIKAADLLAK